MENILHSIFSSILFSAFFVILFIFATIEIIALFIHRRNRKKLLKVLWDPTPDLSSDTLHDILAFFNRKSLSRLRSVNSRFNRTIRLGFANTPYLLLRKILYSGSFFHELIYSHALNAPFFLLEPFVFMYYYCSYKISFLCNRKWSRGKLFIQRNNNRYISNDEMINDMLGANFVRFTDREITCYGSISLTYLLSMRHLCQTFSLSLSQECKLTKFYARRLAKCQHFNSISFCGRVTLLPELLLGNCQELEVTDYLFITADSPSVPWKKILDFLFRAGETKDKRYLIHVETKDPPSQEEYVRFVDSIVEVHRHQPIHLRTPVDLRSDPLHDILAFFDRKCLSQLRSVDSRFNQTIQREFTTAPYLLLQNLSYSSKNCYVYDYGRNRYQVDDRKVVDQILAAKFVHFGFASVEFDDRASLMHFLSTNGNPMQTFRLSLSKKVKLSKFYARRLAKCKNFDVITLYGRVTLIPEFLLGNCVQLVLSDDLFTTADSPSVPWTKILDFLFHPGGTRKHRRLISIQTGRIAPNKVEFLAFSNSVKQRFSDARSPVFFTFTWLTNKSSFDYIGDDIDNVHTRQHLNQAKYFYEKYSEFYMST